MNDECNKNNTLIIIASYRRDLNSEIKYYIYCVSSFL